MLEPTPDEVRAFRRAWEIADRLGMTGSRVQAGLRAVYALHDAIWVHTPDGMQHLPEPELAHEWGFRLGDGREVWALEHSDGAWTPTVYGPSGSTRDRIVGAIDVDESTTPESIARHLPPDAVVLHRLVRSYVGPVTEISGDRQAPDRPE